MENNTSCTGPAPVDMANDLILPVSTRFYTSQVVVWDFFHQELL